MNRSFTARLSAKTPRRLRDYLWATHRVFNESLAYLLKHYFWMKNVVDPTPEQQEKNRLRQRLTAEQGGLFHGVYRDMMGLHLPKKKRAGRSQSAQAWMEQITFRFRKGRESKGPGEASQNILPDVKAAIRMIRSLNLWLFDRELAFPIAPDNGFRRGLFGGAARRILNSEQNHDTHRSYLEDAQHAYARWTGGQDQESHDDDSTDARRTGWRRTVLLRDWGKDHGVQREAELDEIAALTWSDFERVREEFSRYEVQRGANRAREQGRPVDDKTIEKINAGMVRGWRDVYQQWLMPPDTNGTPDAATVERLIREYQGAEPTRIGDVNFFLWLADKPHLWRFVDTMKAYNAHQRRLEQYARPIQSTYPRYNRRPEWFTFSETSPGHMYKIVTMVPLVVELAVFVPNEDEPLLKKVAKGQPLGDEEAHRLDEPVNWTAYQLSPEGLAERQAAYRTELIKRVPDIVTRCGLDAVHEWTDAVWQQLLAGFFRDDPPLDMSRFTRVMVRYTFSTDARLRRFVDPPAEEGNLAGRLIVVSNEQQNKKRRVIARQNQRGVEVQMHPGGRRARHEKWPENQGLYAYWFGPMADENTTRVNQGRYLRAMPLVIGGIRLGYPKEWGGRLREGSDPIFTLSCELDESSYDSNYRRVVPRPTRRIQPSKLGKPLRRDGWSEADSNSIVCRFRDRRALSAVGVDAGFADEFPLPGIRLTRGKPRPTKSKRDPRPVVVEAVFDRSAGWEHKPEGTTDEDPMHYVEDWVDQSGVRRIDAGLRALAIDVGMRHIGTGAVVEFVDDGEGNGTLPNPFKPSAVEFLDAPGISLSHIQRHQDERRRKQRKACPRGDRARGEVRGTHLPTGQGFARELLKHAENLKDDRRKKGAHAILRAALKHKVDYIVFENLRGYRPDFEFGPRKNAALMRWNRRELVEFVKMEARPFGIEVQYVPAHHTSQFCHRCGGAGCRFSHVTRRQAAFDAPAPAEPIVDESRRQRCDAKGKPLFRRRWTPQARRIRGTPLGLVAGMRQAIDGGKQFCCSECGLIVNADYNAAMNLVRRLANEFHVYERYGYDASERTWLLDGRRVGARIFWEDVRDKVQRHLNERFRQPPGTPPGGRWRKGSEPEPARPAQP